MSIYVGNLSYAVTQDDLSQTFAEYGTVRRVELPADRETGRLRGFGFVQMETDAEETAYRRYVLTLHIFQPQSYSHSQL